MRREREYLIVCMPRLSASLSPCFLSAFHRDSPPLTHVHTHTHTHAPQVSRERVGKELEGMLSGRGATHAGQAIDDIASMDLLSTVFAAPGIAVGEGGPGGWAEARACLHWALWLCDSSSPILVDLPSANAMAADENATTAAAAAGTGAGTGAAEAGGKGGGKGGGGAEGGKEKQGTALTPLVTRRLLCPGAILTPFAQQTVVAGKKKKKTAAVSHVVLESLKFKIKDERDCLTLVQSLDRIDQLAQAYAAAATADAGGSGGAAAAAEDRMEVTEVVGGHPGGERVTLGLLVRDLKDLWRTTITLAAARALASQGLQVSASASEQQVLIEQPYTALVGRIKDLGVDGASSLKPLMNGKELMQCLAQPKGPEVGRIMEEQVCWQLQNPAGSIEDLQAHLAAFLAQLRAT